MIIKHCDPKNGTCYFSAETFITKTLFPNEKREAFIPEKENYIIDDINSFDCGRSAEHYNSIMSEIQDLTGWNYCPIEFIFNGNNYNSLDKVIAILAKTKNSNEHKVYVFEDCVWLMTDDGKTIERLI